MSCSLPAFPAATLLWYQSEVYQCPQTPASGKSHTLSTHLSKFLSEYEPIKQSSTTWGGDTFPKHKSQKMNQGLTMKARKIIR